MGKFIDKILKGITWNKLSIKNHQDTFLVSKLPGGFEKWKNSDGQVVFYKLPGGYEEEYDFKGNKIYIHHPGEYKEWREFDKEGNISKTLEYTSEGKFILNGEEVNL